MWATWDRHPFLVRGVREAVYECIQAECVSLRVDVLAIGGVEDHVHLLARVPPTIAPADLVKRAKGASSHMVNHDRTLYPLLEPPHGPGADPIPE